MDYNRYVKLLFNNSNLLSRIKVLSKSLGKKFRPSKKWDTEKISKRIFSFVALIVSIVFGIVANQASQSEAIKQWEKQHFPTLKIVSLALNDLGFKKVQNESLLQKVVKKVPTHLDETGTFWVNSNQSWILYFSPELQDTFQFEVYCSNCEDSDKLLGWESVGIGWRGFEKLLEDLKQMPKLRVKSQVFSKKNKIIKDVRELIY